MIEARRIPPSEDGLAAVAGGAVTRDRLEAAATAGGATASGLVQSLLAQALPRVEDLARVFSAWGSALRLDRHDLVPAPEALDQLGVDWMRRNDCIPVELLDGIAVLAVVPGSMEAAVREACRALSRAVVPVPVAGDILERALCALAHGADRRAVFFRFRELAIEARALEPIPLGGAEE